MSVIETLVTDRTSYDVFRLKQLSAIGWGNMTEAERHEWRYGNDNIYWADGETITCLDGDVIVDGVSNKGAYNSTDMNRVEEAVGYLADLLQKMPVELQKLCDEYGVSLSDIVTLPYDPAEFDLETKTDWKVEDIPPSADLERYLGNVKKLRDIISYSADDFPETMSGLTVEGANAIEKVFIDLKPAVDAFEEKTKIYLDRVVRAFRRSNAPSFWSGNEPLPSSTSDLGRTWEELDAMGTTWSNWQAADWYLLLYGNLKAEGEVTDGV